jgi:hypothetical protein
MRFDVSLSKASGTGARTLAVITFASTYAVTFAAGIYQAVSSFLVGTGNATYGARTSENAATIVTYHASSDETQYAVSGDVILASEPSWATANMEGVVAADVYIAPATATSAGLVDTQAQTFAGVKTFNDGVKQQYGCRVYLASANAQTITAGAAAATVVFATERWDPNNNYNISNGLYTAPKTGLYSVGYALRMTMGGTAATSIQASVVTSASADALLLNAMEGMVNSKTYTLSGSGIILMTAGDTVSIKADCSGQNVTVIGSSGANDASFFNIIYLGPIA